MRALEVPSRFSAPSRELRIGLLGWGFKPLRLVKGAECGVNFKGLLLCR
jgi:hypothetical protein